MLGIIYIYETRKDVRTTSFLNSDPSDKSTLWHLICMNLLVIMLDIVLLGIQYANLFYLQGAFKPCVYGIKLKVEFLVLNELIKSTQMHQGKLPDNQYRSTESRDATLVSHTRPGEHLFDYQSFRFGSQSQAESVHLNSLDRNREASYSPPKVAGPETHNKVLIRSSER
jgi:hypothetical protein